MWDGNRIEPLKWNRQTQPVVQATPDDYLVGGHDAVRQIEKSLT